MSKQILIELVGENETGYCYADLYLPASAEEIAEAKERANWNSDSNGIRDISIEHCSTLPKLASFRLDSPTLDELNFLAQRLDGISGRARLFEVVQRVEEINRYRRSKAPGRKLDGESYVLRHRHPRSHRGKRPV